MLTYTTSQESSYDLYELEDLRFFERSTWSRLSAATNISEKPFFSDHDHKTLTDQKSKAITEIFTGMLPSLKQNHVQYFISNSSLKNFKGQLQLNSFRMSIINKIVTILTTLALTELAHAQTTQQLTTQDRYLEMSHLFQQTLIVALLLMKIFAELLVAILGLIGSFKLYDWLRSRFKASESGFSGQSEGVSSAILMEEALPSPKN